jgi:hypothetical protein
MQKGFIHKQYIFPGSVEHEYYFNGNYGAKGEKRAPKRKRTPEEAKAVNQQNKEKRVRHLIKMNFTLGDFFATCNFGNEYIGRSLDSLRKKEIKNFLTRMRREYDKAGVPFKFIIRIELGARKKRPHIHMIMNRIPDLDKIVQKQWTYGGGMSPHIELLTDDPETPSKLADYITKLSEEQEIAVDAMCGGDISKVMTYSCSRNLERPKPKKSVIKSKTMRAVFNSDLKPTPGYYIDKSPKTLKRGINPYTGLSFLYYQEIKLKPRQRAQTIRLYECPICHQLSFEGLDCNCQKRKRRRGK